MEPICIAAYTATSASGAGRVALRKAISERQSGLVHNNFPGCELDTWIGRVPDPVFRDPENRLQGLESRNNFLAAAALAQDGFSAAVAGEVARFGAHRVGVLVGTSTSSIGRTEEAYRALDDNGRFAPRFLQPQVHNPHSAAACVARLLAIEGPTLSVGTACSSSAKVFASAARWLAMELVDAVVVGGVDSLCLSVLYGFNALQLISAQPCRPFDRHRRGINIGEAAGFALLVRTDATRSGPSLLAYGESSDAHHMSSPHPEGRGAIQAMRSALTRGGLTPAEIGYLNLHGTATRQNDLSEGRAVCEVFGADGVPASSTKGWSGHTLGAAGILEAVICLDALATGMAPCTLNTDEPDPECRLPVLTDHTPLKSGVVMSNSFGFGGSNCCLIFGGD